MSDADDRPEPICDPVGNMTIAAFVLGFALLAICLYLLATGRL